MFFFGGGGGERGEFGLICTSPSLTYRCRPEYLPPSPLGKSAVREIEFLMIWELRISVVVKIFLCRYLRCLLKSRYRIIVMNTFKHSCFIIVQLS